MSGMSVSTLLGNSYIDVQISMCRQKYPLFTTRIALDRWYDPLASSSLPEIDNWTRCTEGHVIGLNWYIYWLRLTGCIKEHDVYRVTDVCGYNWYVEKGSAGEGDVSPAQLAMEAETYLARRE